MLNWFCAEGGVAFGHGGDCSSCEFDIEIWSFGGNAAACDVSASGSLVWLGETFCILCHWCRYFVGVYMLGLRGSHARWNMFSCWGSVEVKKFFGSTISPAKR